jgi:uncharacterized protein (TIGR03084 family)
MSVDLRELLDDLDLETAQLDRLLRPLSDQEWSLATPAPGWSIRDQISHLAYFDEACALAALHPDEFREARTEAGTDIDGFTASVAARYRHLRGDELLEWLQAARAALVTVFADADPRARVPWYGPDMSAASAVTSRIMETWAHGQDIEDTLGSARVPTRALRHVAHLGVRTFANSYRTVGEPVPDIEVRVELVGSDQTTWIWGPPGAVDAVTGSAIDFCRVVTQRRHLQDTDLLVRGPVAAKWMTLAQAFAGPSGQGRRPGQFAKSGGFDQGAAAR